MGRSLLGVACILVIFIIVQTQIAGLMTLPDPNNPASNKPKTWFFIPVPPAPKPPDAQTVAAQLAKKKIEEQANLLRPFAKPYPFDGSEHGYRIIFPGKPTTPQFYYINRAGTTRYYEEDRLGRICFTMNWDKVQPFYDGGTDRRLLDWHKTHYQQEMERLHGDDQRWLQRDRYFKYQNQYEAAGVIDYYHFTQNDDYHGQQMCRCVMILKDLDLYEIKVEGNAEIVSSKLADDFFNSFQLVPKVEKKK
jgi:hypothetical protein